MSPRERKPDKRQLPLGLTSQKQFEEWIVTNAVYFVAVCLESPGHWVREQFETPQQAMDAAATMRQRFGRGGWVSAVTASGRYLTLDRADWPRLAFCVEGREEVNGRAPTSGITRSGLFDRLRRHLGPEESEPIMTVAELREVLTRGRNRYRKKKKHIGPRQAHQFDLLALQSQLVGFCRWAADQWPKDYITLLAPIMDEVARLDAELNSIAPAGRKAYSDDTVEVVATVAVMVEVWRCTGIKTGAAVTDIFNKLDALPLFTGLTAPRVRQWHDSISRTDTGRELKRRFNQILNEIRGKYPLLRNTLTARASEAEKAAHQKEGKLALTALAERFSRYDQLPAQLRMGASKPTGK